MDNHNDDKKDNYLLNEIISPIFGRDYKDRVIEHKTLDVPTIKNSQDTNYLEKQIEVELEAKNKIAKVKEYQESYKTDTDVLKQYQKEKEAKEIQAALPSNYLNFRDSLEKITADLSTVSDFDYDSEDIDNTISEIIFHD